MLCLCVQTTDVCVDVMQDLNSYLSAENIGLKVEIEKLNARNRDLNHQNKYLQDENIALQEVRMHDN